MANPTATPEEQALCSKYLQVFARIVVQYAPLDREDVVGTLMKNGLITDDVSEVARLMMRLGADAIPPGSLLLKGNGP